MDMDMDMDYTRDHFQTATHGAGDPRPGSNSQTAKQPNIYHTVSLASTSPTRSEWGSTGAANLIALYVKIVHGLLYVPERRSSSFHFPDWMVVDLQEMRSARLLAPSIFGSIVTRPTYFKFVTCVTFATVTECCGYS